MTMRDLAVAGGRSREDGLAAQNASLRREIAALRARLAELERLADTDTLVPLPNRRAFLRELERVIHRSARHGTPSAVLFVDLNGLKQINDRLGHQAGDTVLLHVARILKHHLRATDTVARIGGDEFGLILDHVGEADAVAKSQVLVAAVADAALEIEGEARQVSVTAGLAMIEAGDTVESVLARADAAMYAQRSDK